MIRYSVKKGINEMFSLDVGCKFFKHEGSVAIDIKLRDNDIVADAHFLPFNSDVFPRVIMKQVLEHLGSPFVALMEVRRVLKKDGVLEVSIPNVKFYLRIIWFLRNKVINQTSNHIYCWGVSEISNLLYRVGFEILSKEYDTIERLHTRSMFSFMLKHLTEHHLIIKAKRRF